MDDGVEGHRAARSGPASRAPAYKAPVGKPNAQVVATGPRKPWLGNG